MYVTTGARFYTALDNCMQRSDQLETECLKDIESARMFRSAVRVAFLVIIKCFIPCRLLTKLGTVVDRTELNMETTWAETGDRSVQILIDLCYDVMVTPQCLDTCSSCSEIMCFTKLWRMADRSLTWLTSSRVSTDSMRGFPTRSHSY